MILARAHSFSPFAGVAGGVVVSFKLEGEYCRMKEDAFYYFINIGPCSHYFIPLLKTGLVIMAS